MSQTLECVFNASRRISLSFNPMIIWSLTTISSAVHWGDSQLKLQCLASNATRLQNATNGWSFFCKFDWNWKCFGVMFSVWFVILCHSCYKFIPLCTFSCCFCSHCHTPVCAVYFKNSFPRIWQSYLVILYLHTSHQIVQDSVWWWIFRCSLTDFPPFYGYFKWDLWWVWVKCVIEVESIVKVLEMLSTCFQDVCWDRNVDESKLQHVLSS